MQILNNKTIIIILFSENYNRNCNLNMPNRVTLYTLHINTCYSISIVNPDGKRMSYESIWFISLIEYTNAVLLWSMWKIKKKQPQQQLPKNENEKYKLQPVTLNSSNETKHKKTEWMNGHL